MEIVGLIIAGITIGLLGKSWLLPAAATTLSLSHTIHRR